MAYWLLKSEPDTYSWDQLVADGRTNWDGVRNPQAINNLRAMHVGDEAFFYHSGEGKAVVGIARIAKGFYPDPKDASGRCGMVDVVPVQAFKTPVTLAWIKAQPQLSELQLVRQSRLSVMPIDPQAWKTICRAGGIREDG